MQHARPDRFFSRLFWITLAAAILIFVWRHGGNLPFLPTGENAEPRLVSPRGDLADDERSTIELFEKSRDSVVHITTRQQVMDFWSRNIFSVPRGTGSGFIWDDAVHVVTNLHVIEGAASAQVRLADGRDYKAALVGASPVHDIAVLRIGVGGKRPNPIPIGASHDLKVGQKVFAIGNPFGLDWSLTTGIVSALDRSLSDETGTKEHLIQTDAAINPGNSGGPLLDSAGRLIGINTAIYSPSGASAGVGFAVPVDTINRVVPQLIRNGKYVQPGLGIDMNEDINRRLTQMFNVEGVAVLRVTPGSAASRAGMQGAKVSPEGGIVLGDVIKAVEGKPVDSVSKLLARLDDFAIGDTVRVTVQRGGAETHLNVTLEPGS